MKLPVKLISRARRTPMACGSSTVRPQPGITPTRECVSPNFASVEATRKSQFSASSKPPVMATPLTAPMSGLVSAGNGPRTPSALGDPSAPVPPRLPPLEPSSFRSRPAQNAGSAPVRMSTSTSSRASASRISLRQQRQHLAGQGVARRGTVEGDGGDAIAHLEQHDGHAADGGTPPRRVQSPSELDAAAGRVSRRGRRRAGSRASGRRASRASTAIQPPRAPKCSSSNVLAPSASVCSASSYRPS